MPVPPSVINRAALNAPKNYTQNAFRNLPGNNVPAPIRVSADTVINSFKNVPTYGPRPNIIPSRLPQYTVQSSNNNNLQPTGFLPALPTLVNKETPAQPSNNLPELPTIMQPTTGFGSLAQVLEKRNAHGIVVTLPPFIVYDALLEEDGITYILQENNDYILY